MYRTGILQQDNSIFDFYRSHLFAHENLVSHSHKISIEQLYGEMCFLPLVFLGNLKLSLKLKNNIFYQHQHEKPFKVLFIFV